MKKRTIYEIKDATGIRELLLRIKDDGNLVFDGWDLNKGAVMGVHEYEWTWTVPADEVPNLLQALGIEPSLQETPLLDAVHNHFKGENSTTIQTFLDENKINYKTWTWRS